MQIEEFEAASMTREIESYLAGLGEDKKEGFAFGFVARREGRIVGHLLCAIRPIQPMAMGALDLLDFAGRDAARPILEGHSEAFVLDFEVGRAYRRQGIGTALQRCAIRASQSRQLHQLRGWSSYDAEEVFRIKLGLGFAAVPGTQYVAKIDKWVPGAYFVLALCGQAR